MSSSLDIWKMLAGVAIFMLGMNFLEDGLRQLTARPFKLFLKKHTSNNLKAVAGGAIVAAVLQSSSIVNLMVLAFVGAGIVHMQNALAIILGANLGTTLTSWILATIGFNFNIESFALPIAGVSGIVMILTSKENLWHHWFKLLFGFGFLFLGLNYIRTGIEDAVQQVDLSSLNQTPVFIFLVAGILITSLIQSSSATVAIVLSALHVNAIGLFAAMAIVLGSEVGTTLKLVLASLKGSSDKKRVALGNVLFNVITTIIIFIFLLPVNRLITGTLGIADNLLALVFFQTLVNIASILLFYPFLGAISKFLQNRFKVGDEESLFISKVTIADTGLALDALEKETQSFVLHVISFVAGAFNIRDIIIVEISDKNFHQRPVMEKYDRIKHLHGEIHGFYSRLQNSSSSAIETERLEQLVSCVRNCMYAAKNIRDALLDIEQLRNSSNDTKYNFYLATAEKISVFIKDVYGLIQAGHPAGYFENITRLYHDIQQSYTQSLQDLYKEGMARHVNELEISTLVNFNREMYIAYKSMIFGLKDYLLSVKEAERFDELPGFIR